MDFPFREAVREFMREYSRCPTYWYVPKARVLSDENAQHMRDILRIIFDDFLEERWCQDTQTRLHERLRQEGLLDPYKNGQTEADRNALVRIVKRVLSFLGLLWVKDDAEIVITDAGFDFLTAADPRAALCSQIAKYQYPTCRGSTSVTSQAYCLTCSSSRC